MPNDSEKVFRYPLKWRAMDALERGLDLVWPRRLGHLSGWAMLLPAFLLVGILVLGLFEIADASLRTLDRSTFRLSETYSLENFGKIADRTTYWRLTWRSLTGAGLAVVFTLALAIPYSYMLVRVSSAFIRKVLLVLLFLPFFIGQVVRAYGILILLGTSGAVNDLLGFFGIGPYRFLFNFYAVVFGLVQYMLPFAVLLLAPAFTAIPRETETAASSLGANWLESFWYVTLPMAKPGLIGAAIVVGTLSLTDFAMPAILGGGGQDFIANAIYDQIFSTSDLGLGAALTLLLVALGSVIAGGFIAIFGTGTLGMGEDKR